MKAKLIKDNIGNIDNLLKPKSEKNILKYLTKLYQMEKDEKLFDASIEGQLDIVKLLIKAGADINAKNEYGDTPLIVASRYNQMDIVKLLIKAGADINIKNKGGNTALMIAFRYGYEDIVDLLLKIYGT